MLEERGISRLRPFILRGKVDIRRELDGVVRSESRAVGECCVAAREDVAVGAPRAIALKRGVRPAGYEILPCRGGAVVRQAGAGIADAVEVRDEAVLHVAIRVKPDQPLWKRGIDALFPLGT